MNTTPLSYTRFISVLFAAVAAAPLFCIQSAHAEHQVWSDDANRKVATLPSSKSSATETTFTTSNSPVFSYAFIRFPILVYNGLNLIGTAYNDASVSSPFIENSNNLMRSEVRKLGTLSSDGSVGAGIHLVKNTQTSSAVAETHRTNTLLMSTGLVYFIGLIFMFAVAFRAPVGYEDSEGFHLGKEYPPGYSIDSNTRQEDYAHTFPPHAA